jgi:hypothetical protein
MDLNTKKVIANNLIQNLDIKEYDLRIIKQALMDYWYQYKDSPMQDDIEKVERKINKLMGVF